jgi:hypothetical protein
LTSWLRARAGRGEDRGGEIDPLHQLRATSPGGERGRPAEQQRDADCLLVHHRALEHELVVAEHLPVIAGEDDQRVLAEPLPVQRVEDAPDLVVHQRHHRVVRRLDLLQLLGRVRRIAANLTGVRLARSLGLDRRLAGELVRDCDRAAERFVQVALEVLLGGAEAVMGIEEVGDEQERLVAFT